MSDTTEGLRAVLATMRDILGDQRNFACECIIFANQEDPEKHRPSCPWRACSEGAAALASASTTLDAGASSHPEGVAAVCICIATPGGLMYRLGCPFLNKDGTHE